MGRKSVYSTQERPPRVNSWFDRKSWCCKDAAVVEDEEKRVRGEESSVVGHVMAPQAAVVVDRRESGMDWSGLEWLSKVYNGRKSKHLSGLKSLYISGDER